MQQYLHKPLRLLKNLAPMWHLLLLSILLTQTGCSKQSRVERLLKRADKFYQAQQTEKARIEYLNVLRLDPNHPLTVRRLGLIYYDLGRGAGAFQLLSRAKNNDPNDLEVRGKLGQIFLAAGRLSDARQEALAILQKQPQDENGLLLFAFSSLKTNEIVEAQQHLERARAALSGKVGFHRALAQLSIRQRNYESALRSLNQALAIAPKSPEVLLDLGNLHSLQGKTKDAEQAFQVASELSPARSFARIRLADFKIKNGSLDEGKAILEQVTREAPDFAAAWAYLAQIAFAQQNFADSRKFTEIALTHDPVNLESWLLRARINLNEGKLEQGLKELEELKRRFPQSAAVHYQYAVTSLVNKNVAQAFSSLEETIRLDGDHPEASLLLAELKLRRGDHAGAISDLTAWITKRPGVERPYLLLADSYRARGAVEQALETCRKAADLFPKSPRAAFNLGLLYREQKDVVRAREAFEKTLLLIPGYLPALTQLIEADIAATNLVVAASRVDAELRSQTNKPPLLLLKAAVQSAAKQPEEAVSSLKKAIELDPAFAPAYYELARVYSASGKNAEAIAHLDQVLKTESNDIASLLMMGTLQERQGDYPAAARYYERIVQVNPKFVLALNNLAYLYAEHLGTPEKGYEYARRAREIAPTAPHVADTFGWVIFKRGDYPWALSLFQESAEALPDQPDVQYHLAMASYMMGEEAPARLAFRKVLELDRAFARTAEIERRLGILDLKPDTAGRDVHTKLEQWLQNEPKDLFALLKMGMLCERDKNFTQAEKYYARAREASPKAVAPILHLVELYMGKLADPQKAFDLAKNARTIAPNNPVVSRQLAELAYANGDYAWSASLLQDFHRREPAKPELLTALAHSYYGQGLLQEARQAADRALQLASSPTQANDLRWFVAFLDLHGDPVKAAASEAEILKVLKAQPDHLPAQVLTAAIAAHRGQSDEAIKRYQTILRRSPNFIPAAKGLALLQARQKHATAYESLVKVRSALPNDSEVARALGKLYYERGEFARAVPLLQTGTAPEVDPEALYYLGLSQFKLNQKKASEATLNQALALGAQHPLASEAKKALAQIN